MPVEGSQVRTDVAGWGTEGAARANLRTAIVLPFRRRQKPVPAEPPRIVRLLRQAEEWRQALDRGAAASRAALARREGCSAMRVTQVLALLDLDGEVLDMIRALPAGTPERLVTERWLRTLRGLPAKVQREAVRQRMCSACRATGGSVRSGPRASGERW